MVRRRIAKRPTGKNKPEFDIRGYVAFRSDVEAVKMQRNYERLRAKLSLKTSRESYEKILALLDSSADDHLDAVDLFLMAKDEWMRFDLYYKVEMGKLMYEAQLALEKLKRKKIITSQITKELKETWLGENRLNRFEFLENKKRELKIILRRMENLKDTWRQRMSSIQSQARAIESKRAIRLGEKDGRR